MTPLALDASDETRTLLAPPLELTFQWDGARWRHWLRAEGALVAASVEWEPGRDDLDRIVSPSYQQLHIDEYQGAGRAMLVGQWGAHHGSAAFVFSTTEAGVVIDVDVAVRSRASLQAMACTYQVERTSSDLIDASERTIGWTLESQNGALWLETTGSRETLMLGEAGRRATRAQVACPVDPGEATQRLRYRWRWTR